MDTKILSRIGLVAAALLAWPCISLAAVSAADIAVASKSLGFVTGLPTGSVEVMVIYDPGNATSRSDAEAAAKALAEVKSTKHNFKPVLTPIGNLGTAKIAYISEGMDAHFGAIRNASSAHNIFTFTHDLACIEARACAMYVSATPNVTIQTSQSALAATNYELSTVLKMMIKEVP